MTNLLRKLLISALLLMPFAGAPLSRAQNGSRITHVLVISIDGMHSHDMQTWIANNPTSALAGLAATGVNYTNAFTTQPSDSIPSTVGIFTGASPSLGGMYYDDAWHRVWAPPAAKGACVTGVANGTLIDLKQGIDVSPNSVNSGGINPANLVRDPFNGCAPVYPHNMMRVNTIFEVIRGAGMYTAYSEKRPSYDFLNGPSGTGVQDLYVPEINGVNLLTPSAIEGFDNLRVTSILNEIRGLKSDGSASAPTPNVFGMNFQAINSAKKASNTSGYDASGNFDATLQHELAFVDGAIGSMLSAIRLQGLANSTAVIITAKHGESPLTSSRTIVDQTAIGAIVSAGGVPVTASPTSPKVGKTTQKTSELIWLPRQDSSGVPLTAAAVQAETTLAVSTLTNSVDARFQPFWTSILSFGSGLPFPDPTVDPASPDIVVVMKDGVNFEPQPLPSPATFAEHGGFGENETHVPLLVSYPTWAPVSVSGPLNVATRQIAPTVLSMLGLNPAALDAVRIEGIASLPEVITRLDTTPPVIVPTVTPSPNVNGWNNSAVSVSWSVTDPESGISSSTGCTATSLTTETSGTVVTCSATNAAGLPSTVSVTIKIDMTPPSAMASTLPLPNANNWNNGSVTVTFTGTDSLSGIDTCTAPVVVNTEGAGQSSPSGTCTDKAGNTSAPVSKTGINIDLTAPVITFAGRTPPNTNGWNNTAVTLNWNCTDALSGTVSSSVSVTLTTDGANQSATGTCQDKAGNQRSDTQNGINIDSTPPVITFAGRTPPNANGWNNTAVTLNWNCSDALSGVVSSSVSVTLAADGANQSATGTCKDKAGNQSSNTQSGINIDRVPPVLIVPASVVANATSPSGAAVSYIVTASDALDPSPVVICSPSSGSIFPIGNTSVACTATDRAGNTSSGSFVVTVKGAAAQVNDLLTLVSSFNLSTLGNSLTAKLQNIQSKLSGGQTNAACGQLGAFINEVTDQSGQGLTVAQANQLIAAANQISALVGCSNH